MPFTPLLPPVQTAPPPPPVVPVAPWPLPYHPH